ncbi:MAG: hypothetical protein ABI634_13065 [Acidobacteriota bacterium]
MWLRWTLLGVLAIAQTDPQPLQRMAAAERAFAAAAAEQGWRDAALAYVAADAIELRAPEAGAQVAGSARPSLAALPLTRLPVALREMWEPAFGSMSSDGTLGWTVGPEAALNLPIRSLAHQGAYFHLWRRQDDGTWKVGLIDEVRFPNVWQDAAPFTVVPMPDTGDAGQPNESLADVERGLAADGRAWSARLSALVRVHRAGQMPFIGRAAVAEWAASRPHVRFANATFQIAASDDLGVSFGSYDTPPPGRAERGTWIRAWQRDVTGRWRVVFETSQSRR